VRWAVDRLLEAFGPAIISKIYERLEEVPREEIESIKARLEKARKEGVGG
jgi:ribose 1,5-bisphosphokinase PhnN